MCKEAIWTVAIAMVQSARGAASALGVGRLHVIAVMGGEDVRCVQLDRSRVYTKMLQSVKYA